MPKAMRPVLWTLLAVAVLFGCRKDPSVYTGPVGTPYVLELPSWVVDSIGPMLEATDNPLTVEGVALGRKLFYEKELSDDGTMSCATCHVQSHGFSDPRQFSVGTDGSIGDRNAMAIVNLGWSRHFFWDGRRTTLEDQAHDPVTNPIEMRNTWPVVEDRLRSIPTYADLFAAAFGSPQIDSIRITQAIAQFERTLVSFNSPFDRYWYGGDTNAISQAAKDGLDLYTRRGNCDRCHTIGNFTDDVMRNNGLDLAPEDPGLGAVTGLTSDYYKFKTTSLRNIAVTAPYMHDGRFADLLSVVQFYRSHTAHNSPNIDTAMHNFSTSGYSFSLEEQSNLLEFLNTLTDEEFLTNPAFSAP
jgi:cytochrome c peroxidase